jgi:hypothetical protein
MYEYKVVYWEDETGELCFGTSVKSRFQQEINDLSQEGWVVKFSNLAALPPTNAEKKSISVYALLEREKIPAPFRERSKNTS